MRDGRRRFRGLLQGIDGDDVSSIVAGTETVRLPFSAITRARLVLTDALIAATNRNTRT